MANGSLAAAATQAIWRLENCDVYQHPVTILSCNIYGSANDVTIDSFHSSQQEVYDRNGPGHANEVPECCKPVDERVQAH